MTRLSDEQLRKIQAYMERAIVEVEGMGLRPVVSSDMEAWAGFLAAAPSIAAVTTTFDPQFSYVHPGNCYWLSLRDSRDNVAGCICFRLFLTDDIITLIRSWRLFFDKAPLLEIHPLTLVNPSDIPIISGRVGYGGGYWLHPDYRGRGLSRLLPRMNRALGLRHFDVDWAFGLTKDSEDRATMITDLGLPNRFSCIRGYFPPRGEHGVYQLIYAQRGEMLRLLYEDLARPEPLAETGRRANAAA